MEELRYPIGRFKPEPPYSQEQVADAIGRIERAPVLLAAAVRGLSDEELDTRYRPDGWTLRQVVHHLPDSHMQSYGRFKWALTEDEPTRIKPYFEDRWARLPDAVEAPIELSLDLLAALHRRWVHFLRTLSAEDLARTYRHPEWQELLRIDTTIALYAWHGEHHVAHITSLRDQQGW